MNSKFKMILLYDIACKTKEEKEKFRKFNTRIKKIGFMMLQQSVYVRTISSKEEYRNIKTKILDEIEVSGNIRTIIITENKYSEMELLIGEESITDEILDHKKHLIIL